jgi:hypothetical protein
MIADGKQRDSESQHTPDQESEWVDIYPIGKII